VNDAQDKPVAGARKPGVFRLALIVLLSGAGFTMPVMAATELFCSGTTTAAREDQGDRDYLIVLSDDLTTYEVFEGKIGDAVMAGDLRHDRLFFHESVMGEYQAVLRDFQLSRVTLKYAFGYTQRNGVYVESSGQCEPYRAQI